MTTIKHRVNLPPSIVNVIEVGSIEYSVRPTMRLMSRLEAAMAAEDGLTGAVIDALKNAMSAYHTEEEVETLLDQLDFPQIITFVTPVSAENANSPLPSDG